MREYPWYDIVEESEELEQGDFINDCEVLIPTYISIEAETSTLSKTSNYQAKGTTRVYDVVIVSQSCDLENGKLEDVLVCPRISYSEFVRLGQSSNASIANILGNLEQIRLGRQHRYCMLNECKLADLPSEIQVVDLGKVFSIPYDVMKQMAKSKGKRLCLLSPYKEKLAQAFAYYYMRVALPIDIPKFEKVRASTQASIESGH